MGHSITAVILKGDFHRPEADKYDLRPLELSFNLHLFFIDIFFTSYWQEKLNVSGFLRTNCKAGLLLPKERVLYQLMANIARKEDVEFALIITDYFGGSGKQCANVFRGDQNADKKIKTINEALCFLGVDKAGYLDEFRAVGLDNYRANPEFLDKYSDLADEMGV